MESKTAQRHNVDPEELLRCHREAENITKDELCERFGISRNVISKIFKEIGVHTGQKRGRDSSEADAARQSNVTEMSREAFPTLFEEVADGTDLTKYVPGSHKKIQWKCSSPDCGHVWTTELRVRARLGCGCPACNSGRMKKNLGYRKVSKEKSLGSIHPTLLDYWDYDKNTIDPFTISPTSEREVHWHCPKCDSRFERSVKEEVGTSNKCLYCGRGSNSSFPELFIYFLCCQALGQENVLSRDTSLGFEIDVLLPDNKIGFEFGSWHWHEDKQENDLNKILKAKQNQIQLYVIYDNVPDDAVLLSDKFIVLSEKESRSNYQALADTISTILHAHGLSIEFDLAGAASLAERLALNVGLPYEETLAGKYPDVAAQWDYRKNAPITPDMISASSNKKFFFTCDKGHSYSTAVAHKTRKKNPVICPVCSGKAKNHPQASIAYKHPELYYYWNWEENGLPLYRLSSIRRNDDEGWQWSCPVCSHEWSTKMPASLVTNAFLPCPSCRAATTRLGYIDASDMPARLLDTMDAARALYASLGMGEVGRAQLNKMPAIPPAGNGPDIAQSVLPSSASTSDDSDIPTSTATSPDGADAPIIFPPIPRPTAVLFGHALYNRRQLADFIEQSGLAAGGFQDVLDELLSAPVTPMSHWLCHEPVIPEVTRPKPLESVQHPRISRAVSQLSLPAPDVPIVAALPAPPGIHEILDIAGIVFDIEREDFASKTKLAPLMQSIFKAIDEADKAWRARRAAEEKEAREAEERARLEAEAAAAAEKARIQAEKERLREERRAEREARKAARALLPKKPREFNVPAGTMTASQAAKALGLSSTKSFEKRGILAPAGRHGKVKYFDAADVEALAARMEEEASLYVTFEEAAAIAGVDKKSIHNWYKAGKFKHAKEGLSGKVIYLKSELEEMCGERDAIASGDKPVDHALSVERPDLVEFWDYEKNSRTPAQVSVLDNGAHYWTCPRGHSYQRHMKVQLERNGICPKCFDHRTKDIPERNELREMNIRYTLEEIGRQYDVNKKTVAKWNEHHGIDSPFPHGHRTPKAVEEKLAELEAELANEARIAAEYKVKLEHQRDERNRRRRERRRQQRLERERQEQGGHGK